MSERNDLDVLELIHHAAQDAPPMQVSATAVLRGGRRRVNQRRSLLGGLTLAAAAAAAAVAIVVTGQGSPLSQDAPPPAEQDGEPTPVVSGGWDAELTFEDGTTFTLRPDGEGVLAESPTGSFPLAESELVGGPVLSTLDDGRPIILIPGWDPSHPDAVRLRSVDVPDSAWTAPTDTARVELADGRTLIVLTAAFPDHQSGSLLPGEIRPDGSVALAEAGPAGTSLVMDGEQVIPTLDGEPLPETAGKSVPGARSYDAGELGEVVLFEGPVSWQAAAIVQGDGAGPVVREDLPRDVMPVTSSLLAGLLPPDTELLGFALRSPEAVESGAVNEWTLAGAATHGNVALDGGVVAAAEGLDVWLLTPTGADLPVAGAVDEDVIAVRTGPTSALLVTVHHDPTAAQFHLGKGAGIPGGGAATSEEFAGSTVTFATVTLREGETIRDSVMGVDTDGDGVADLPLTQVVDLTGAPLDEG